MKETTYLNEKKMPYPFCPGCSHSHVLDYLNAAMVRLNVPREKLVVVTDIGCVGLSDQWFTTHAFHGLHGRSVAYGQGLKLAEPDLHVIVLMGDGGAGIGGHHLLSAARRNIGVTVLLLNNFNFGMTGGEHSVTTPSAALTPTTAAGNLEQPFKIPETLHLNGAGFTARRSVSDGDLEDVILDALAFDGFALVEILEYCTAYYVPFNKLGKSSMAALQAPEGFPPMLKRDDEAVEYTRRLEEISGSGSRAKPGPLLEPEFFHTLKGELGLVIAGSAGLKIKSATTAFARAGILSGLYALQRDDYPVTIKTGFSLSFLKLSPDPVTYPGLKKPNLLFILSIDGLNKVKGMLELMEAENQVFILKHLDLPVTRAQVIQMDLSVAPERISPDFLSVYVLYSFLLHQPIFSTEAFRRSLENHSHQTVAEKSKTMLSLLETGCI